MEIILVPQFGFCFGVKRAIDMSVKALREKPNPCQVLGTSVHNEFVIERLKKQGIKFINSLNEAKKGTIIIPAHGEDPKVLKKINKMGHEIVDTTCPLVTRTQNLAKALQKKGYQVIIIGDKEHKEVKSIQASIDGKGIIIEDEKEIAKIIKKKNLGVVVQTTQNPERVDRILKELKKKFKEIKFYNTFCPTVQNYQKEVRNLAPKVDLMLIVGSKTSANTKRLAEIAETNRKPVYHIKSASEFKKEWFSGIKKVGIAGGTSTPDWLIKEVINKLKQGL